MTWQPQTCPIAEQQTYGYKHQHGEHCMTWHKEDRRVVQLNYAETTSPVARGARAYLVRGNPGNGHDRIVILARSRGGRWIEKWEDIRRLDRFRVKTLTPAHPLHGYEQLWDYEPDQMVTALREAKERCG